MFIIIATTIAGDPTTQEGAKHAYCMDWGDCEHCVDENKHCKPLGKTVWKWECMDEQVQQKTIVFTPSRKITWSRFESVVQCWEQIFTVRQPLYWDIAAAIGNEFECKRITSLVSRAVLCRHLVILSSCHLVSRAVLCHLRKFLLKAIATGLVKVARPTPPTCK